MLSLIFGRQPPVRRIHLSLTLTLSANLLEPLPGTKPIYSATLFRLTNRGLECRQQDILAEGVW